MLCGSSSYCTRVLFDQLQNGGTIQFRILTVPHGIGNIGDKISLKESHDAHGNVHELPSGKRLLKVHATRITHNHVLL